jgi:lipopolysaccharide biosynthesis regulator YciM
MSDESQRDAPEGGPAAGVLSALEALRPSLPPDRGAGASSNPVPAADGVGSVGAAPPAASEQPVPESVRPGLLSAVLSRPPTDHDPGAQTAYKSIGRRAAPDLRAALAENDSTGQRERASLIEHLAQQVEGAARARLLTAAAEQWQRAAEPAHAAALYEYAHANDPRDLVALRELRKQASAERDHDRVLDLLAKETELSLTSAERAAGWLLRAEIERGHLGDEVSAERSAETSFRLHPSASAGLLLWELRARAGRYSEAAESLQQVAQRWVGEEAHAALLFEAGRARLDADEPADAQTLFEQAQAAHPERLEAALACYRVARANGDRSAAMAALELLRRGLAEPGVSEDLLRHQARLLETTRETTADAAHLLAPAQGQLALRLRARLFEKLGDRVEQRASLEACKALAGGSERAFVLLGLAELHAADRDFPRAANALREAAVADGRLLLVRAMQATLARVSGDATNFAPEAESAELEDMLEAAARAANDVREGARELSLLERAGGKSRTAALLALDVALELGRAAEVDRALSLEAEQAPPAERLGLELALADVRRDRHLQPSVTALTGDGAAQGAVLVALHRIHSAGAGEAPGALWLELSAALRGEAAACTATLAGDHLTGKAKTAAYERALSASPGHAPAAWALERLLREPEDRAALARVHSELARSSADPQERAARLLRSAALLEEQAPETAAEQRRKAAIGSPTDALLCERALHKSGEVGTLALAELLADAGHSASGALGSLCKLRAAALYEDAAEPARAAVLYGEVLDQSQGEDRYAATGLERALAQAGLVGLLFERLERLSDEASAASVRSEALERLALLQAASSQDRRAASTFGALLELDPDHVTALRALQRRAFDQNDLESLESFAEQLARRPHDLRERAAQQRLTTRTRELQNKAIQRRGPTEAALGLFHGIEAERTARARGDGAEIATAVLTLCAHIAEPNARASYAMRAAEALERGSAARAIEALSPHAQAAPSHTLAHEMLGRLLHAAGDAKGAALEHERSALGSTVALRTARLWYRAATLWQDAVGDDARARQALDALVAIDVMHRDAFARLRGLLSASNDAAGLVALLQERIAAGGEPALLTELHVERSRLLLRLGQRDRAAASLKAALALDPQRVDALRAVAELHLGSGEYREAAEALIRFARLAREPAALREAFMALGRIYTEHAPDLRRAEIAFGRAVELQPADVDAVEQLMRVYRRKGELDKALRACERLQQLARDEEELDRRTIELASVLEDRRELLRAERALNDRRELRPASAPLISALADLYARQYDHAAMAVHLDRSSHALRAGILEQPDDAPRWNALCDVLARRGRMHAAECAGALAKNLGLADARSEKLGAAYEPLYGGALSAAMSERLWPEKLSLQARELLRWLAPRAHELLPDDRRLEKPKDTPALLREALQRAGARLRLPDVTLIVVDGSQCLPLRDKPLALGVGSELLERCDADELAFLLLRALCTAQLGLSVAVRTAPDRLRALHEAALVAAEEAEQSASPMLQLLKEELGQRQRRELQSLAVAASAGEPFDPSTLAALALQAGAQVAFAARGGLASALSALGACAASEPGPDYEEHGAFAALSHCAEARALLRFALTDAYLELHSVVDSGAVP